jgi:hypothetical protein
MHISQFRPDISFATGSLSNFMNQPGEDHLIATKRVLRHLAGTIHLGLLFRHRTEIKLTAYVDSDWATDSHDRKSITGYVTQVRDGTISARREKQEIIALSSTEAEYVAATSVGKEILFLRQILADLGYDQSEQTPVGEDNSFCIKLSENEMYHRRSKHIDIKYHWIRAQVAEGKFKLNFVPSIDNVTDITTKPLGPTLFLKHRKTLLGM